ncbi:hypothetical protein D3C87_1855310 [compost metagenome]
MLLHNAQPLVRDQCMTRCCRMNTIPYPISCIRTAAGFVKLHLQRDMNGPKSIRELPDDLLVMADLLLPRSPFFYSCPCSQNKGLAQNELRLRENYRSFFQ